MKKLSILLALILALSCFSFAASAIEANDSVAENAAIAPAAETTTAATETTTAATVTTAAPTTTAKETTTAAPQIPVLIKVIYSTAHSDGSYHDSKAETPSNSWDRDSHSNWVDYKLVYYFYPQGTTVTGKDIHDLVLSTAQNNAFNVVNNTANKDVINGGSKPTMVIDGKEFTLNDYVFQGAPLDFNNDRILDDVQVDPVNAEEPLVGDALRRAVLILDHGGVKKTRIGGADGLPVCVGIDAGALKQARGPVPDRLSVFIVKNLRAAEARRAGTYQFSVFVVEHFRAPGTGDGGIMFAHKKSPFC